MEIQVITERFVICHFGDIPREIPYEDCEKCNHFNYTIGFQGIVEKIECKSDVKVGGV